MPFLSEGQTSLWPKAQALLKIWKLARIASPSFLKVSHHNPQTLPPLTGYITVKSGTNSEKSKGVVWKILP